MIGRALTPNKSLTTLNLCYNKITCEGAASIAKVIKGLQIALLYMTKSNKIVILNNFIMFYRLHEIFNYVN